MVGFLVTLHILVSIFLMLIVIMQPGKGADLAGAFGGGGSQTAFGARGAATLLHKLTVALFILFILTSVMLAVMMGRPGSSVMAGAATDVDVTAPAALPADGTAAAIDDSVDAVDPASADGFEVVPFGDEPAEAEPVNEETENSPQN